MRALRIAFVLALGLVTAAGADARESTTATVAAGVYRPLFPASPSQKEIAVPAFELDRTPVTNGQFLAFVAAHPEWRRDRVAPVFAESGYLAHWQSPDALGPNVLPDEPVVNVSWFGARAYCGARGMRLPTEAEWERAAAASRDRADGSSDPAWRVELLALYTRPSPSRLPAVASSAPDFWGIYDLHGLIWEWVSDFSASAAALGGSNDLRFCGAGGGEARDATDFPAFQRVALRSSLRANYTIHNLGFRCAKDAPKETR